MTLHPNPTSPPGKAATEGLDSRCGLVGIEGPEKAAVRLFQRARAKPMDARLWSPTGTPFTTSAIKSFFEQEIYKHPTEWWGVFIWDELYYQVQQRIEEKEEVHMNLW